MEAPSDNVDFPNINVNSRILVIIPACNSKFGNCHRNSTERGAIDYFDNTEWTERVVRAIQMTGIQTDFISIRKETHTSHSVEEKLIVDSPGNSKEEASSSSFSIEGDLIITKDVTNCTQQYHLNVDIPDIEDEFFRTILDSVKERLEYHEYSLVVFVDTGIGFGKVINERVKEIRKAIPNKTTRILIESCHIENTNNCSINVGNESVLFSNGIIDANFKDESVYLYTRKQFGQSIDAVTIAAIGYIEAIGVPFEKIPRLLSCKTIYETAIKNTPLNTVELIQECGRVIYSHEGLVQLRDLIKQAAKTSALTTGCFDIFHAGHAAMLEEGKTQADVFIVGLNSDESVRRLKGSDRPICSLEKRMFILLSLKSVDFIVVFKESRPDWIINILDPDVFVKGPEYTASDLKNSFPQLKNIYITADKFDIHTSTIVDVCKK